MSFPLTNMLLARPKGLAVSNDDVLSYFDNRTTQSATITASSEYLTGIYQQPDLGAYSGSIHDLTEQQITDLANGLDYDGLGTSIPWSTLEKVWVLENLETSSSNSTLRYVFSFTYTASLNTVAATNSGARGQKLGLTALTNGGGSGATDWINPTDGLAQDWSGGASYDHSIVTGNGFAGNAQRVENPSGFINGNFNQASITVGLFTTYRLRFKYRLSSDALGTGNNIQLLGATGFTSAILSQNTGNAKEYITPPFTSGIGGSIGVYFNNNGTSIGDYIEIDEVELLEASAGATDWEDSNSDGLADGYATSIGTNTPTIENPVAGFLGNVQKIARDSVTTPDYTVINGGLFTVTNGSDYVLSCRLAVDSSTGGNAIVNIYNSIGSLIGGLSAFVGDNEPIIRQGAAFTADDTQIRVELVVNNVADAYFDELELIEV